MVKKILLIDDDEDEFYLMKDALAEIDKTISFSVIQSPGEVAKDGACNIPDLLFLDINMPVRDGFEWMRLIRQKHPALPVIIYSTSNSTMMIRKAYEAGATLYFAKPHDLIQFKEDLKVLLQLDWSKPENIAAKYREGGEYRLFSK